MKTIKLIIGTIVISFLMYGCKPDNVYYESFEKLDEKQWAFDTPKELELNIDQEGKSLDVKYSIRHNLDYGYNNIFIKYALLSPSGDTLESAMKESQLLNPNTGQPNGVGSANNYTYYEDIVNNYTFSKGKYKLVLQQYMREDTLENLIAVGVRLDELKSKEINK